MKWRTIPRYGVRSVPGDEKEVVAAFRRGEAVEGPAISDFENRFAAYHYMDQAIATSYGRMAFFYLLQSLEFPRGSEIIFPALTFWAVPEIARCAGLKPIFVDVNPRTFNLEPRGIEPALTDRTRAIVPTHLYGQPCDMSQIMSIADKHHLVVIEDCAQAVGARYRGRLVGTFGLASFYSFQMLKGINTYGGGMAMTNDTSLASRVRKQTESEPLQSMNDLVRRFSGGLFSRIGISPKGFTFWGYPIQASASIFGHYDLSKFVWERIRELDPLPREYRQRYSNAQALLGIRGLAKLDDFNARSRKHATRYSQGLAHCCAVQTPYVSDDVQHVYYQYCIYTSDSRQVSRRAIRRGVDFETTHVDVCSSLPLFKDSAAKCPGADFTTKSLQLPVYSRLRDEDVERVLQVVKTVTADLPPLSESAKATAAVSVVT